MRFLMFFSPIMDLISPYTPRLIRNESNVCVDKTSLNCPSVNISSMYEVPYVLFTDNGSGFSLYT